MGDPRVGALRGCSVDLWSLAAARAVGALVFNAEVVAARAAGGKRGELETQRRALSLGIARKLY